MNRDEIISKIKELKLPSDSYVVFGSSPMAVLGIREARDIDLYVSKILLQELAKRGWQEHFKKSDDMPLVKDVFEAHDNWNFSRYNPKLSELQSTAIWIKDIPFASLEEVRKWKIASGGLKNFADVELIDKYLKTQL